MENILTKLGLTKYINIFRKEKISPDIICDMSLYEMACLGLHNKAEIMNLRTACIHFGNRQVRLAIGLEEGPSRSTFQISKQTLEGLLESDFEVKEIAELLSVSESTVYRRMRMYNLKKQNFTEISDERLVDIVNEVSKEFPRCGEKMVKEILRQKHVHIPRYRLRDILQTQDEAGIRNRTLRRLHRRVYHVQGPNHIWHVDTNHKLIRWYFVISAGVDGFSRMIMFIRALDNNRADTLLQVFTQGVAESGIPLRVRTDKGMENVKIADFMLEKRGNGSMITGKSVHNQRVERMWRDVYDGALGFYSELFSFLEDEGKLNIMNPLHIYALHYVYMQKINEKLKIWKHAWNTHRLRTVGASPQKLWTSGMVNSLVTTQDAVSADYDDTADTGIVSDITRPIFGRTDVQISDNCRSTLARECPKDWSSSNYGIELYEKAIAILEVNHI